MAANMVKEIKLDELDAKRILDESFSKSADGFFNKAQKRVDELKKIFESNRVWQVRELVFNLDLQIILPDVKSTKCGDATYSYNTNYDKCTAHLEMIKGLQKIIPRRSFLRNNSNFFQSYFSGKCAYIHCLEDNGNMRLTNTNGFGNCYDNDGSDCNVVPYQDMKFKNFVDLFKNKLFKYELFPKELSANQVNVLKDLWLLMEKGYASIDDDAQLTFKKKEIYDALLKAGSESTLAFLAWDVQKLIGKYKRDKYVIGADIESELLNCEKVRADIEPYEGVILTDVNRGHWDLFGDEKDKSKTYTAALKTELAARDPRVDINHNGVIAIDFGTKSTIVVYQGDIDHSLPMGIGDGDLSREPSPKRYENPTVMHFVNLEDFLTAYAAKEGRPSTKWEDLTVSHTAMEQLSNSKSSEYYEYMYQIKQWAGNRKKLYRIKPHKGESVTLPAFLDLKEDDFNPIEIYAYYIGLYINNMRKGHGIYLDYYLSFPATYESQIRQKITESFAKGLKKSLPSTILNDEEVMKHFCVHGDISEPAAYAVCALQEYGFEPDDDKDIYYAIFDFGGGTTDFDFGLWKVPTKSRYTYAIEHFGGAGDRYLGGENLLEMLAFEIFKANQKLMREKKYTFTLAPKCSEFVGSDALLADSQEAEKNMRNLVELIRPYWEQSEKYREFWQEESAEKISDEVANEAENKSLKVKDENEIIKNTVDRIIRENPKHVQLTQIISRLHNVLNSHKNNLIEYNTAKDDIREITEEFDLVYGDENEFGRTAINQKDQGDEIVFKVTLFNKDGKDTVNETLKFSKRKLYDIIKGHIRDGIINFFAALRNTYAEDRVKKPTSINIFLAGNSCKSPIVQEIFQAEIKKHTDKIAEESKIENAKDLIKIFPPLGTEAAYKIMEDQGITVDRNSFERPTGKTGVAFGLIECRQGAEIQIISETSGGKEIPFEYFIGRQRRGKFQIFKDAEKATKQLGKPDYNVWYKFIEADAPTFELYYTSLPDCVKGEFIIKGNPAVLRHRCDIDVINEDAFVFIRAKGPHCIEYVVASDKDDVEGSKLGEIFTKELK